MQQVPVQKVVEKQAKDHKPIPCTGELCSSCRGWKVISCSGLVMPLQLVLLADWKTTAFLGDSAAPGVGPSGAGGGADRGRARGQAQVAMDYGLNLGAECLACDAASEQPCFSNYDGIEPAVGSIPVPWRYAENLFLALTASAASVQSSVSGSQAHIAVQPY